MFEVYCYVQEFDVLMQNAQTFADVEVADASDLATKELAQNKDFKSRPLHRRRQTLPITVRWELLRRYSKERNFKKLFKEIGPPNNPRVGENSEFGVRFATEWFRTVCWFLSFLDAFE